MLLTCVPFSGEPNGLHQFLHGFVQWTQNQDPSSWLTLQRHAIETPQGDDIIGERRPKGLYKCPQRRVVVQ